MVPVGFNLFQQILIFFSSLNPDGFIWVNFQEIPDPKSKVEEDGKNSLELGTEMSIKI